MIRGMRGLKKLSLKEIRVGSSLNKSLSGGGHGWRSEMYAVRVYGVFDDKSVSVEKPNYDMPHGLSCPSSVTTRIWKK